MPPPLGRGCSSGVEHNLAKVGVEGSNPFARSKFLHQINVIHSDWALKGFLRSPAAFKRLTDGFERSRGDNAGNAAQV